MKKRRNCFAFLSAFFILSFASVASATTYYITSVTCLAPFFPEVLQNIETHSDPYARAPNPADIFITPANDWSYFSQVAHPEFYLDAWGTAPCGAGARIDIGQKFDTTISMLYARVRAPTEPPNRTAITDKVVVGGDM